MVQIGTSFLHQNNFDTSLLIFFFFFFPRNPVWYKEANGKLGAAHDEPQALDFTKVACQISPLHYKRSMLDDYVCQLIFKLRLKFWILISILAYGLWFQKRVNIECTILTKSKFGDKHTLKFFLNNLPIHLLGVTLCSMSSAHNHLLAATHIGWCHILTVNC